MISVESLRKRYGDNEAVRGINMEVRRGEIFAFLGPNGAGKTTTVEILEGFREATSGSVEVLGANPWRAPSAWRERIGIVLQESEAEPGLTVRECLKLYGGYYHAPRAVAETLALVGLSEQADERASKLSGGQRRRLDVALALIGDPELIFLDEPTTGFDPAARRAAWNVIDGLRELGKTILLTTHYMEEAERLADRIAIISAGEIVAEGTPQTLGDRQLSAPQITFQLPQGTAVTDLPPELTRPPRRSRTADAAKRKCRGRPSLPVRLGTRVRTRARRPGGPPANARRRLSQGHRRTKGLNHDPGARPSDPRAARPSSGSELSAMFYLLRYLQRLWREYTARAADAADEAEIAHPDTSESVPIASSTNRPPPPRRSHRATRPSAASRGPMDCSPTRCAMTC